MHTVIREVAAIGHEVRKIVKSPYAPSLQPLYEILSKSTAHGVGAWLNSNDCCIEALAATVLDSIRFYPASAHILHILIPLHDGFRQTCISHAPLLLASCLDAATTAGEYQQKYYDISMSLLSKVKHDALPAKVSDFLNRFVKNFTKIPDSQRLGQALALIQGTGIVWPLDCLEGIQATTLRVLREGHDDEGTSLRCLAILAALSQCSQLSQDYRSQCGDFFSGKKSNKALVLGITSCIKSLSAHLEGKRPASEVAEHLCLAKMVFETLDNKSMLVLDRTICLFTRKLCEKLDKESLDQEVQLAGATALAVLLEDKLQQVVIDLVERIALDASFGLHSTSTGFRPFIARFSDSFAPKVLQRALELCVRRSAANGDTLAAFQLLELINHLFRLLPKHPRVRDSVRKAFAQPALQQLLTELVKNGTRQDVEPGLQTELNDVQILGCCSTCMTGRVSSISLRICQLFLLGFPDTDLQLSSLAIEYIASCKVPEDHPVKRRSQTFDSSAAKLVHENAVDITHIDSARWRDTLTKILHDNADVQAAELNRYFQGACLDLERRCHEIEKPLHEKDAIIRKQNSTIDELRLALESQEHVNHKAHQVAEEKTQQISNLESQLKHSQAESSRALDECIAERDAAVGQLNQAAEDSYRRESQLQAQISSLKDEAEQRSARCVVLDNEVREIMAQLSTSKTAYCTLDEKYTAIEAELTTEREANVGLINENTKLQRSLEDMAAANSETHSALHSKTTDLNACKEEVAQLRTTVESLSQGNSSLEHQISSQHERIISLEQEITAQMELLTTSKEQELSDQSIFYDQALEQLRLEVKQANENASMAGQRHQDELFSLKVELKTLRREKEKRAKELAQAQQLGRQLMGLMQQPEAASAATQSPAKKTVTGDVSTNRLSDMLNDRELSASAYSQDQDQSQSQVPDSFTSLRLSPMKRKAPSRRALSELPPQSPVKNSGGLSGAGRKDRRTSWAPQQHKRKSSFHQAMGKDENLFERSFDE